jgi:hypothetical protein
MERSHRSVPAYIASPPGGCKDGDQRQLTRASRLAINLFRSPRNPCAQRLCRIAAVDEQRPVAIAQDAGVNRGVVEEEVWGKLGDMIRDA